MKLRFILFAGLLGVFAHDGKAQTCEAYVSADPPATNPQRILRLACLDTAGFTVDRSNPARPILKVKPVPGPQGIQGIQGVKGDKGDPGPAGPPGTGTGLTGGPCSTADTHMQFWVQLPDGTCLKVVVTGTTLAANGLRISGENIIVAADYFQGKPYPHVTICGVPVEEIRRPVLMRPECAFPGESMALLVR